MNRSSTPPVRVAVYGGRSMTGVELLRLLAAHPAVRVPYVVSRGAAGRRLDELEPGAPAYSLVGPDEVDLQGVDLAFLCLGHGQAGEQARVCREAGVRVIDLSGDHRLRASVMHQETYGSPRHEATAEAAVYGLPELCRDGLADADMVANPGCYPTAVTMALAPLARRGWARGTVIVDAKSGVSGAGRAPSETNSFCSVAEDVRPYKPGRAHRHVPEMEQALADAGADLEEVKITFVPQLIPAERGILANVYVPMGGRSPAEIRQAYLDDYGAEPFVEVLPEGRHARMRAVRGTNRVQVSLAPDAEADVLLVTSVIDNLVKGAAGQAVQNMNRMVGLAETTGLAPAAPGGLL